MQELQKMKDQREQQSKLFLLHGKVTSGHQHHLHAYHLRPMVLKLGCHQRLVDVRQTELENLATRAVKYELEPLRQIRGAIGDQAYRVGGVCSPQEARISFWLEQRFEKGWTWKRQNPSLFKGTGQNRSGKG